MASVNLLPAIVQAKIGMRALVIGVAVLSFILLSVLPVLFMLVLSLTDPAGNFSFEDYRRLIFDARQRELLLNSMLLGAGAAFVSVCVGAPLGFLLGRADLPFKRSLRLALIVPLVVPPYVLALAWVMLVGGFSPELGYSLTGAVLVLGASFYPLSMLATEAAVRGVDRRLEEAALLAARRRRVLWRITFPLIAPVVAAAFLIVFVLAVAEFGVPGLLRVRVFTTEVFTAFAALYDFGAATAFALPVIITALIASLLARMMVGEKSLTFRRGNASTMQLTLGRWRYAAIGVIGSVILMAFCLPFAVLFFEAVRVRDLAQTINGSSTAVFNSLALAATGATLVVILAALLGYARARAKTKWSWLADVAFVVFFAVPSTVVGVGIIGLWNRSGWLGMVYGSQAIIVVAYLARFTPVAALMLSASVRQIPASLEEAAFVSGANWQSTFVNIVLPNMKAGIVATWVTIFIFTFGELGSTLLVAPPGESTLPVRIYTLIANAPPSEVAALALLQSAAVLIPLVVLGLFIRGNQNTNTESE